MSESDTKWKRERVRREATQKVWGWGWVGAGSENEREFFVLSPSLSSPVSNSV